MIFEIYSTSTGWVDLMPYIEYHGIDGSREDIGGPNAGQVIFNALTIRDKLASKRKWNFTTMPINNTVAKTIETLLEAEFFRIRTDYFTASVTQYDVFCSSVTKTYVRYKGYDMVKLSFPIVER